MENADFVNKEILFDGNAKTNSTIVGVVEQFLQEAKPFEFARGFPIIVFQDGKRGSFYLKCNLESSIVSDLLDFDAKLDSNDAQIFVPTGNSS